MIRYQEVTLNRDTRRAPVFCVCNRLLLAFPCILVFAGGFGYQKVLKPFPVLGSHAGKLYSIANLDIARRDNAVCAHLYIIDPEHSFQFGSYRQGEHHLHVKTTHTEISSLNGEWS